MIYKILQASTQRAVSLNSLICVFLHPYLQTPGTAEWTRIRVVISFYCFVYGGNERVWGAQCLKSEAPLSTIGIDWNWIFKTLILLSELWLQSYLTRLTYKYWPFSLSLRRGRDCDYRETISMVFPLRPPFDSFFSPAPEYWPPPYSSSHQECFLMSAPSSMKKNKASDRIPEPLTRSFLEPCLFLQDSWTLWVIVLM